MVPELRNLEYTDRLRAIKLPSMYYRRARGDMIEVYKYLHGKYNVEEVPLLLDEIRVTRGHSRRLKKERVQTRQRRNHFRHRTVNRWNSLTEEVVSAPSLNSFIIIIIIINVYFRPTTENSEGPYSKYIMITYRYIIQTKVSVT